MRRISSRAWPSRVHRLTETPKRLPSVGRLGRLVNDNWRYGLVFGATVGNFRTRSIQSQVRSFGHLIA